MARPASITTWLVLALVLTLALPAFAARYRYMSYGGINRRLRLLAAAHGDVLTLYNADKYLSVASADKCRSSTRARPSGRPDHLCETLIADIGPRDAPAVLVLGSLHGDERLGAVAALALVETLVLHKSDEWVNRLARSRRVVVVPMPNPSAYDKFSRFEPGPNGTLLDAASDFPFVRTASAGHPVGPGTCLRSTAARTVHALFGKHLFRVAVALHSRREFISHSWGSDRREFCTYPLSRNATTTSKLIDPASGATAGAASGTAPDAASVPLHAPLLSNRAAPSARMLDGPDYEDDGDPDCVSGWSAPDARMLSDIAGRMSAFAGARPGGKLYPTGALNDPRIANPVSGGFADYAYAASFRPDLLAACAGNSSGASNAPVTPASHRAAALIFETSREAAPSERTLGSPGALYHVQKGDVIPRVLRGLLLAVDVAQPYAFFTAERRPRVARGGILRAQWSVGGAVTVDRTYLQVVVGEQGEHGEPFLTANQTGSSMWGQPFEETVLSSTESLFDRIRRRRRIDRFVYDDSVLLYRYLTPEQRRHGTRLSVRAVAHVDSAWGIPPSNASGRPPVSADFGASISGESQSHLARSRSDTNWNIEHAGVRIGYEGMVMSDPIELSVPPLTGWLVWRDLAFISILLCVVPPAVLFTCFRKGARMAVGPSSRSLARLRLRQLRKAQGWFNSSKSAIQADIAEMQRLRGRVGEAP